MPAQVPLYQGVEAQLKRITAPQGLRRSAVRRLALLVTGISAASRDAYPHHHSVARPTGVPVAPRAARMPRVGPRRGAAILLPAGCTDEPRATRPSILIAQHSALVRPCSSN